MSIKDHGFLSVEAENWRKVHLKRQADWFDLAKDLNVLAQRLWNDLPVGHTEEGWIFTARVLYLRGLTSYQAAVILTGFGLTVDADIITRSVFEDLFCLSACKKDESLLARLQKANALSRKKLATAVAAIPADLGVEPETADRLRKAAAAIEGEQQALNFAEIAESAGLKHLYDVYYRSLSNDAAHPTIDSLERIVKFVGNDEVEGFVNTPSAPDMIPTIARVCVAGYYLVTTAAQIFSNTKVHEEVSAQFPRYQALLEKHFPQMV